MKDYIDNLFHFMSGVWRFRWTTLIAAWTLALLGWLMIIQIDSRYPATARLFVDTNRILEPLLDGIAVQPDVKQRVAIMSKTLLNRPNIEQLIATAALDSNVKSATDREDLIEHLQAEISIEDTNGARSIYALSYSHRDPAIAMRVVESMIDIFVNSSLDEEKEDNNKTITFLNKQIADYEVRLVSSEDRLSAFKRKHAGSLPGESGGFYQRMENLVSLQRRSGMELKEADKRRDALRVQLRDEERKIRRNSQNGPINARIEELQNQLDELLVRYTAKHPRVSILQQSIADLQTERSRSNNSNRARTGALQKSVVYQKLSTLLAEANAEVAQLGARNKSYSTQVEQLKGTVDSIPLVEAELKQLDRDYETIRAQHNLLLQKRESAQLTGNVERDSNDVKIRQVDPPFVPSRATDPDKLLLNAAVLLGAIAAAVTLGFILSILYPVFYTHSALEEATDIPVLGGVTLHRRAMAGVNNKLNLLGFTMLSILLPVLFGWLVVTQIEGAKFYEHLKFRSTPEENRLSVAQGTDATDVPKSLLSGDRSQ